MDDVPAQYRDWYRGIDDPLAWQKRIDMQRVGPNTRGATRFWTTVADYGFPVVSRNGVPDFNRIVFALTEALGLELTTDETTPFIRYRFVALADEEGT
jgi:hypothetical protein